MDKRLFRNEHDKMVAGVSSGIAEYMEVDGTIIRLLFVLSTIFLVGTGVLVYIIMWIVVPVNRDPATRFNKFKDWNTNSPANPFGTTNPFSQPTGNPVGGSAGTAGQGWTSSTIYEDPFAAPKSKDEFKFKPKNNETGRMVGGLFLLVIGMYFLLNEFDIIPYWFNIGKLWPLVFVAIGLSFILKSKHKNDWENWKRAQEENLAGTAQAPVTASPVVDEAPVSPAPATSTPAASAIPTDMPEQSSKIDDRFTKKNTQDEN